MQGQFLLGPQTEGRFALAQRSPTLVGSICRDNLPSVRHESRLTLARGGSSNGSGLIHRPESPLSGGVRDDTRWLGDSTLLAKFTLSPRQYKWLRRRVLCDVKTACDWAKMSQSSRQLSMRIPICLRGERAALMHRVKVWGARDSPNGRTLY